MSSPLPIIKVNARAPFIFPEIRRGEGGEARPGGQSPLSKHSSCQAEATTMKLQSLRNLRHRPAAARMGGRYWLIVRITTSCGITGLGEV